MSLHADRGPGAARSERVRGVAAAAAMLALFLAFPVAPVVLSGLGLSLAASLKTTAVGVAAAYTLGLAVLLR
ncbi:MAG: hypothetical protein ABEI39_06040 [Halobacteriales archaeon]